MRYQTALNYLHSFLNYERLPFRYHYELNLARMRRLLSWFGHPDKSFHTILVAGTKGKGSTANFLASLLSSHGLSTGLYTSPHLSDPRERIQIDGRMISKPDFAQLVERVRPVIERHKKEIASNGMITYFEMMTLFAVLYFARQKARFGIFEIGMGGRFDATNALKPVISVITPISFDHEEHLGNTLSRIAAEKAAIIQAGCEVVSAAQETEAERIIQKQARETKTKTFFLGKAFRVKHKAMTEKGSCFDFEMGGKAYRNLKIKLPGQFQIENASCALAAGCLLQKRKVLSLSEDCIKRGLAKTFWPGRFEVIRRKKQIIVLDGAHNDDSMRELVKAVKTFFPVKKYTAIIGLSREKNLKRTLTSLIPQINTIIATKSRNIRAQEPRILLETLKEMRFKGVSFWASNIYEALKLAGKLKTQGAVLLITGSLFLVAEAREHFKCRKLI
jgi:dihydrofolate synthase/folylpolyglutamate synthase